MSDQHDQTECALDQPGSADENTIRQALVFSLMVIVLGLAILLAGDVQLRTNPHFSTFYACFVFLVDAITAYLLLGQLRFRRRKIYAGLASAYLFKSLIMLPFLLAFPGVFKEEGALIGGDQTCTLLWSAWHLVFPAMVGIAVFAHRRDKNCVVPAEQIAAMEIRAMGSAIGLVLVIALVATAFHDHLALIFEIGPSAPAHALISSLSNPLTVLVAGGVVGLCWYEGTRQKTKLHIWLAITLLALLIDVIANLGASPPYTVGWYFSRIEAMIAASILLLVFMAELNDLYHRLGSTMDAYLTNNQRLASLLQEKEALVTNLQYSEAQIRQLAYYDPLTELPNRRLLLDRLGQALNQARRHQRSMAVMFMDLDRFKEVNDSLGHDAGDKLLVEVARRMLACLRRGDTASRSGGDEFIVVLSEISHPIDAAQVAEKILAALQAPVDLNGHATPVSISIGIAIFPTGSPDDVRDLMQKADRAMYVAKAQGRNCYRFHAPEMGGVDSPLADPSSPSSEH